MNQYVKKFPKDILPHITDSLEVIDQIHNYPKPKFRVGDKDASYID